MVYKGKNIIPRCFWLKEVGPFLTFGDQLVEYTNWTGLVVHSGPRRVGRL